MKIKFENNSNSKMWISDFCFIPGTSIADVTATQKEDLDELSKSDIECLSSSFYENQELSFEELIEKSKDNAWKNADNDNQMNIEEIANTGGANE